MLSASAPWIIYSSNSSNVVQNADDNVGLGNSAELLTDSQMLVVRSIISMETIFMSQTDRRLIPSVATLSSHALVLLLLST